MMPKLTSFSDSLFAILAVAPDGTQTRIGRYHGEEDHTRFRKTYGRLSAQKRVLAFRHDLCWLAKGSVTRAMQTAADAAVDFRFVKLTISESR
jgi:hypothetical protein